MTQTHDANKTVFTPSRLTDNEFSQLSSFIYKEVGITLPPAKKIMLEARLQKRLRTTQMSNYKQYLNYVFSPEGIDKELHNLIDCVTTNTTDFFREPKHFEYLEQKILTDWYEETGRLRQLELWSAGCSIGMEPYTLAMVMSEFAEKHIGFKFNILATDISTEVLKTASRGVYDEERIAPVPMPLKKKYFLRSKDPTKTLVKIAPELRALITFGRLNFMEEFHFDTSNDIIFCRNVVIYFDRATQEVLFNKFCRSLCKGGYLFIGHSESLAGMDLPLQQMIPTVYKKI